MLLRYYQVSTDGNECTTANRLKTVMQKRKHAKLINILKKPKNRQQSKVSHQKIERSDLKLRKALNMLN